MGEDRRSISRVVVKKKLIQEIILYIIKMKLQRLKLWFEPLGSLWIRLSEKGKKTIIPNVV